MHCEKILEASRKASREAEQELKKALGLDENAKFNFDTLPPKAVLKALSILIGRAETIEELRTAQTKAEVFKKVSDCNTIGDTTNITVQLHSLVDDIETFIRLSTSTESDKGALISNDEADIIFKLIKNMDTLQNDLTLFVNSRVG